MDDNTNGQNSTNRDAHSSMVGQWSGWMQDYESGNYDNLPHDEISSAYRNWSRSASPEQRYEATYHGYQQLPQDQWGSAAEDLYNYGQDRNLDLSGIDVSTSDYRQWNAQDMARITEHVYAGSDTSDTQSEQSSEKKSGLSIPKPVIGLALAGGLAYAASRFLGGKGDKDTDSDMAAYQQPSRIDTSTTTGSEYTTGYNGIQDQDRSSDQGSTASTGTMGTYGSSSDYSAGSGSYGSTADSIGNSGDYSAGSGSSGSSGSNIGNSGDRNTGSDLSGGGSSSYNSGSSGS